MIKNSRQMHKEGGIGMTPKLLGLNEARIALGGISESLMRRLIIEGQIKSLKVGRRRMILPSEIERFIQEQAQNGK